MKLPLPLLLYCASAGLFALAGWTVYEMLPMWKEEVRTKATTDGQAEGKSLIDKGRSRGARTANWVYSRETEPWWASLKKTNWTGKLPPPPPKTAEQIAAEAPPPVVVDQRPLEQVIELVSLVYDGQFAGKGGNSHVIVRYKPEANVQPPDWWVKENVVTASASPATRPAQAPRDTAPNRGGRGGRGNAAAAGAAAGPAPTSPMPTAATAGAGISGREVLQKIWVADGGDQRRSAQLWPVKSNDGRELGSIRLARVAPDAQSAYFVRELPPARPGEAAPPAKEEELIKTVADLSQDILKELRVLQGRTKESSGEARPPLAEVVDTAPKWVDVEETTRDGNRFNIGRKDEQRFRDDSDAMLEQVTVDTYVSRSGARGLIVKAADQQIAGSLGVVPGDVLIEVNGQKVESKMQTVALVKDDYRRGVRNFVTKWMSNGQIVERSYTAPNR
jgi:hypothetical protein